MSEINTRPLITFALFTYNQEQYIADAVRAALAQTYSPLEIVISDDGSADQTFSVILATIAGYSGPHQIRVNRNPRNLGVGEHTTKMMMELAKGELIVMAAGDDVSLPERTQRIYQAWEATGRRAFAILSGYRRMTECGQMGQVYQPAKEVGFWTETVVGYLKKNRPMIAPGCVQACHRDVFSVFGPITLAPSIEDNSITLRAMLLGRVLLLPDVLVNWRMSGAVSKAKDPLFMWRQDVAYRKQSLQQFRADFSVADRRSVLESICLRYVCCAGLLLANVDSLLLRLTGCFALLPLCKPVDAFYNFKLIYYRFGRFSIRKVFGLPLHDRMKLSD